MRDGSGTENILSWDIHQVNSAARQPQTAGTANWKRPSLSVESERQMAGAAARDRALTCGNSARAPRHSPAGTVRQASDNKSSGARCSTHILWEQSGATASDSGTHCMVWGRQTALTIIRWHQLAQGKEHSLTAKHGTAASDDTLRGAVGHYLRGGHRAAASDDGSSTGQRRDTHLLRGRQESKTATRDEATGRAVSSCGRRRAKVEERRKGVG
ncbi:hypothetical protein GGX14DRAFT_402331 [Mycena pura]|uniref:Uncharacterized protein n=1 Tax=Mycena pura TaxID=153505 RepID=A0AAD6V2L0_9AGAR|nr:hypothetical protein GGX14DRAFT_402331 [Mycena pura]